MNQLTEMLTEQLQDAHSAEKQAIQAMKRTLRKTSAPELRRCIEEHIAQSEEQRQRVEELLERMGGRPGRKVCEAMRGLVEEAAHELEEHEKGALLDLVIVAGQQRVEHYEIAAYGTMAEMARATGHAEEARIIAEILEEEKQQDQRLTEVTSQTLMPAALEEVGAEPEPAEAGNGKRRTAGRAGARGEAGTARH